MAHKKAAGSTRLGRDSKAKRLGVKIFGGQHAKAGAILVKQRGSKYAAGDGVAIGKDDSLYALTSGLVHFKKVLQRKFTGSFRPTRIVSIVAPVAKPAGKTKKAAAKTPAQA